MRYLSLLLVLILAACQGNEITQTAVPPTSPVNTPTSIPTTETAVLTPSSPHPFTPSPPPSATAVATQSPPTPTPIPPDTPVPTAPVTHIQLAQMVRGGLDKPVYLTHAGDERLFVVEQDGRIRIVQNGQLLETPFLDIDSRVGSEANEQGLLSVAFHPHYAENGRFFVNYTNNEGNTVIGRYQVNSEDPNRADPDSEVVLLTIPNPMPTTTAVNFNLDQIATFTLEWATGAARAIPTTTVKTPTLSSVAFSELMWIMKVMAFSTAFHPITPLSTAGAHQKCGRLASAIPGGLALTA